MPGSEEGQSQKYCTNCGAQVRTSNAFCVSCGASLSSGAESSGAADPDPTASRGASSLIDDAKAWFGETKRRLGEAFSGVNWRVLREIPDNALRWFEDLPFIVRAALAGVVLLVILTLLSPLVALLAVLAFAVCFVILIVQAARRRAFGKWAVAMGSSLVLMFVFAGVSGVIYDTNFIGGNEMAGRGEGEYSTECGIWGCPDESGEYTDGPQSLPADEYEEPIDIHLVESTYVFNGENFLSPGYLLVDTEEQSYTHFDAISGQTLVRGDVGPNGELSVYPVTIGNLSYFPYACTYDAADPRGAEVSIPEACGFSIPSAY